MVTDKSINYQFLYNILNNIESQCIDLKYDKYVIFDGNLLSKIVFLGFAPGQCEEEYGKCFIGPSGIVLRSILKKLNCDTMPLFINAVPFKTAGNKIPEKHEQQAFLDLYIELFKLLDVQTVICFGKVAEYSMSIIRNKITLQNIVYTFHPSYFLRTRSVKVLDHIRDSIYSVSKLYSKDNVLLSNATNIRVNFLDNTTFYNVYNNKINSFITKYL